MPVTLRRPCQQAAACPRVPRCPGIATPPHVTHSSGAGGRALSPPRVAGGGAGGTLVSREGAGEGSSGSLGAAWPMAPAAPPGPKPPQPMRCPGPR